ncbi:MAG: chromate transporter [Clostridiales bacterium]|nr:chromate transporter [Clostridiales bacterium]
MIYLKLFLVFFKIGLFAIGGGLATFPFLQEIVDKYGWITSQQLLDMIAISESTPGPIGINTATFVGNNTAGLLGGIIATLGLVAPSIIIIVIIAHYFAKFNERPIVRAGFYGLRPAVIGLIGAAGFEVAKVSLFHVERFLDTRMLAELFDFKGLVLFGVILALMYKFKRHPITYLVGAAIVGIIFKF